MSNPTDIRDAMEEQKRRKARRWLKLQRLQERAVPFILFLVFLVFASPAAAYAAPVFAFILGPAGLALMAEGAALSIVSSVLAFAATTAATYLLSGLFAEDTPEPKTGARLELATGDTVPQSFIVGTYATAGSLVYIGTWGDAGKTPNLFLTQVVAVGDLPYSALNIDNHFIDDVLHTINTGVTEVVNGKSVGHPVSDLTRDGKKHMWVKFKDGTQTTQDPYLAAVFNSLDRRAMDSDFIGRGRAYVIITTRYNPDLFSDLTRAVLNFDGIKLYDPRKDSTNGGSGSHRYGDYSTYEFSANNKVIHYNAKRGIYYGDNDEWMWGGQGLPAYLLDNSTWFAAMNECDVNKTLKAGGTEKQFRMGAEIYCDSSYADFSDMVDLCTNARTAEYCGVYKTYIGGAGASVLTFTDDDIIVTLDQSNKIVQPTDDVVNAIIAQYTEPSEGWQQKSTKPRTNADFLIEDGGVRQEKSVQLPVLTSNTRAQRVVAAMLKESRRFRTHLIALGPHAFRVEPLDSVTWNSDKYGYTSKKFIVGNVQPFRELGYIVLAIRELHPEDVDFEPTTDEDDTSITPPDDSPPASEVLDINASPISIKNNAGTNKIPALKITWDKDDEFRGGIKWVAYQVRLLDTGDTDVDAGQVRFNEGKVIISKGILKQEFYQVRILPVPFGDRPVDWTDWVTVQAPNTGVDVNDDAPADLAVTPTLDLITRIHRDGKVRQRLLVSQNTSGRPNTERYRIRVTDTTEDPDLLTYYPTDEFPYDFEVQTGHTYAVRVVPVSRFGVAGNASSLATGVTMPIPKKAAGSVPAVSGESITPGHRRLVVEWDRVDRDAYPDYDVTEIQRSNDLDFSSGVKTFQRRADSFVDAGLNNNSEKWYRLRHLDTSGNSGGWSTKVHDTTLRLDTDDYKSKSVVTDTINPKSIEARFAWSHKGQSQSWGPEIKAKSSTKTLGKSSKIINPNPSAVFLRISYTAFAKVSAFTGLQNGGSVTFGTKISIYSAPINGSGDPITSKKQEVYTDYVKGTVQNLNGKVKTRDGIRTVNKLLTVDMYRGEAGASVDRKYWAEVTFSLYEGSYGAVNFSGLGNVKKFVIQGVYSKR